MNVVPWLCSGEAVQEGRQRGLLIRMSGIQVLHPGESSAVAGETAVYHRSGNTETCMEAELAYRLNWLIKQSKIK